MKVVHICQFLGIGGLEKVLYSLILEQLKSGYEVEMIIYDYERAWVEKFEALGITVHTDYTKKPGYDRSLLTYLSSKIYDYEFIHTHDLNPVLYIGVLKLINLFKFKKFPKFIHTTHGMEHIKLAPKTRIYEKFLAIATDKIIAVSPSFRDYYLTNTLASKRKVFNIDNGTQIADNISDTRSEKIKKEITQTHNLNPDKPIWAVIARIFPLKDQYLVASIMDHFPDSQLLIIGPSGDDKYLETIKDLKKKNVFLLGPKENIDEYLKASDLFISASHHEGIPIAVLEAGAQGVPCVLSNIAGHQTVNKEDNIFTFEVQNPESLIEVLHKAQDDKISASKRDKFFNIIKKEYSAHKMFLEYERVYKD